MSSRRALRSIARNSARLIVPLLSASMRRSTASTVASTPRRPATIFTSVRTSSGVRVPLSSASMIWNAKPTSASCDMVQ
jgi:hypothetical protein